VTLKPYHQQWIPVLCDLRSTKHEALAVTQQNLNRKIKNTDNVCFSLLRLFYKPSEMPKQSSSEAFLDYASFRVVFTAKILSAFRSLFRNIVRERIALLESKFKFLN